MTTKTNLTHLLATVRGAIQSELNSNTGWKNAGAECAKLYETGAAFAADADRIKLEVIYPAMGDNVLATIRAELPKKGSEAYVAACAKDGTYAEQHGKVSALRKSAQSQASVYLSRMRKAAEFADDAADKVKAEKAAQKAEKALAKTLPKGATANHARMVKALGAVLTMIQKDEAPSYDVQKVSMAVNTALHFLTVLKSEEKKAA